MEATALPASRLRLWTEFTALFIGVPILMAVYFGHYRLFTAIWILAGVSAVLLWMTPGWRWRQLFAGPVLKHWRIVVAYAAITGVVCVAFVFWLVPERFLSLPKYQTELWILIMVAYPIASAWPQEVIFRSLFFERYGDLFPTPTIAILANGVIFGFGHLFYMNPVVIGFTALGGAFWAWVYLTKGRSMTLIWILHALAGQIIFTVGLGGFFYHGNVG
ncbi:MAG: CPBP family intramembrane glutamic endopeptidase [Pseudomonadota bacterium]